MRRSSLIGASVRSWINHGLRLGACSWFVLQLVNASAIASPTVFNDRYTFAAITGAQSATGALPILGELPAGVDVQQTVGSVTFGISAPSTRLAFDENLDSIEGAEIRISDIENLNATFSSPVYAFGFDFFEPTLQSEENQPFIDSTFTVNLKRGSLLVDSFDFNVSDDTPSFVGAWSQQAFDRVEIRESVGSVENELFGQFYSSSLRPADVLALHSGSHDPLTENWVRERSFTGINTFPVEGDQGRNAWGVDDDLVLGGSEGLYATTFGNHDLSRAMSNGWKLSADVRVVDQPSPIFAGPVAIEAFGNDRFNLFLGADASGTPIVSLGPNDTPLTLDGLDSGYHRYELTYDPARLEATLAVDGSVVRTAIPVDYNLPATPTVRFGSFANSTKGQGNYSLVKLEVQPESEDSFGKNLLGNPGFEENSTIGAFETTQFGQWNGDPSEVRTSDNEVQPFDTSMLKFIDVAQPGGDGDHGDVLQYVDLTSLAPLIQKGFVKAVASAKFNRIAGDETTDTQFDVTISGHNGAPAPYLDQISSLGWSRQSILSDSDISTWESVSTELKLPANTTFLQVRVSATENIFDDPGRIPDQEFHGHYADDTSLSLVLLGDFNQDGQWTLRDLEELTDALRHQASDSSYDLDENGTVSAEDRRFWVEKLAFTYFGDANLDGEFSSTDLIDVLKAGEYEDSIAMNSSWRDGDFSGDGEFTTDDLIVALQLGAYEQGPRTPIAAVPEPASSTLLLMTFAGAATLLSRRMRSKKP